MEKILLDLKDYKEGGTVCERTAVRGIVKRGDRYLVVIGNNGDCKFPGGGIEEGETHEDTLIREVREETGYKVIRDSIAKEAKYMVHEIGVGAIDDIFMMDSYYYVCDVEAEGGNQDLEDYEVEEGYTPKWLTVEEMYNLNAAINDIQTFRWVCRELLITEKLMNENV